LAVNTQLYKRIDEIIWLEWDPIGVNEIEEARDEYYSYFPLLYEKLIKGEGVKEISKYPDHIETATMGLPGNFQKNIMIAEKLISLKNELHTF
jgi:hypothetical protein